MATEANPFFMIDAHAHLWNEIHGEVNGHPVKSLGNGLCTFNGEFRLMMPPYMIDGRNTVEMFMANMDYAGVNGAVITQEFIDGDQNDYLQQIQQQNPDRFFVCGLAEFREPGYFEKVRDLIANGFKAIKIPAQWLISLPERVYLTTDEMMAMFQFMEQNDILLSIDLAEGNAQVDELQTVIDNCPNLRIAIGHFGMVNRPNWESQLNLAKNPNVMIESGGITWLFHREFYPYEGAVKSIKKAASMVGIDKLMWGSDYPRTMTAITYKMSLDFILKSKLLINEEKQKFLGENACNFYGFKPLYSLGSIRNMVED
jgi:hypothetical protein